MISDFSLFLRQPKERTEFNNEIEVLDLDQQLRLRIDVK
jgi:hypothetical protein